MAIFGYLGTGMEAILVFLFGITKSWGLAIIILTLLIRLVLYPLTLSQTKSMAKMKELQPKMNELKKKFKDKPQEYQQKVMELYKEGGVNPLGGCLPMLVQLPFLWALFRVLRQPQTFEFTTTFVGLNLGQPDPTYILPILAGLTTWFQMQMTSTDPSQKTMMLIMPIFIGYLSINFPVGLVLYWVVSNIFSIGQQYMIQRQMAASEGGS